MNLDAVVPMGNSWLGMFSQDRIRGKLPSVELVLRTCRTLGIARQQRKEYAISYYGGPITSLIYMLQNNVHVCINNMLIAKHFKIDIISVEFNMVTGKR